MPLRRCRRLVAAPARSSRALSLVAHRRRQDFLEKQHDAHEGEGEAYVPPLTLRQKAEIAAEREAEENARRGPPLPAGYSRDEDSKLIFEMSKKMNQRLNPGYTIAPHAATSKADFTYDEDELDPVDKTHFRKRDTFSQYVEAQARFSLLTKKQKNSG